jgi:DNA-binding HxlR family transcriptional regulator
VSIKKVPRRHTKYTRTGYQSPVEIALEAIGGKYKPVILYELRLGPKRYSDLRRTAKNATQKMLTQHLRELAQDGLIERRAFLEVPPRVQYCLTPLGESLQPSLAALCEWGTKRLQSLNSPDG